MQNFGGKWTIDKMDIFIKYVKAYLEIMKDKPYWSLIYFDGFAGSGKISHTENRKLQPVEGIATKILQISNPRPFDIYYFVDKDKENTVFLQDIIDKKFPERKNNVFVVNKDCNQKLLDLSIFLQKSENKNFKVLAFIDPFGMQVNWSSIEKLKGLPIDMWILAPTGLGVNRLLKKNGNISDSWLKRLSVFLGLEKQLIMDHFYKQRRTQTLFGEETIINKEDRAIEKAGELYKTQLNKVFEYVSAPFIMKNKTGSTLFHFFLASNNQTAQKIANDIINRITVED
jgi:three-Cys-motif partner protein